jgi:uncharacterized protein YndB with AHSA1/START domain
MPIPNDAGVTDFSTPSDTEIRAVRVFAAPRELLWAMHTDAKHIPKWMTGPEGWSMPVCELDVRPGGHWRYVWRKTKGEEMMMEGAFVEVVKPSRLVTTERWGPEWPETVNIVEFTEEAGRTVLTMTVRYPSKEARDAALQTGMKTGMNASYARLDVVLAGAA